MLHLTTRTAVRIAQVNFPFIPHNSHIACGCQDGQIGLIGEIVVQGPKGRQRIGKAQLGTEKLIVTLIVSLVIVLMTHPNVCYVLQLRQISLDLSEGIHIATTYARLSHGRTRISIVCIFLIPLHASGERERLQMILIECFSLEGIGGTIGMESIIVVGIVVVGTYVSTHGIEGKGLTGSEVAKEVDVESRRCGLIRGINVSVRKTFRCGNLPMNSGFFDI